MARRSRGGAARVSESREEERENTHGRREADDPRVCESMPGFNDQQRGRGCILAAVERSERSVETEEEKEEEEEKKKRDRQITPGAKRQEARTAPSDLSEAPRGSEPREPPMVSVIGGH